MVDLAPEDSGRTRVTRLQCDRPGDLAVDARVAEPAEIACWGGGAGEKVGEVGGARRVVGCPGAKAGLGPTLGGRQVAARERVREVGVLKTLGFSTVDILGMILGESAFLALIGGAIGIFLVFVMGLGLTHGADFPVSMSMNNVAFGVGISAMVGIIAGIIPAYRASRLDPVVAIRET